MDLHLEYEGNRVVVGEIDCDEEIKISIKWDGEPTICMYICKEQAELLRDHLTKTLNECE